MFAFYVLCCSPNDSFALFSWSASSSRAGGHWRLPGPFWKSRFNPGICICVALDSYPERDTTLITLCPQSGLRFPGSTTTGAGCVLLVSNMSETETECDHLFILFGVYGDVQVGF